MLVLTYLWQPGPSMEGTADEGTRRVKRQARIFLSQPTTSSNIASVPERIAMSQVSTPPPFPSFLGQCRLNVGFQMEIADLDHSIASTSSSQAAATRPRRPGRR